jgi:hypothetical protein
MSDLLRKYDQSSADIQASFCAFFKQRIPIIGHFCTQLVNFTTRNNLLERIAYCSRVINGNWFFNTFFFSHPAKEIYQRKALHNMFPTQIPANFLRQLGSQIFSLTSRSALFVALKRGDNGRLCFIGCRSFYFPLNFSI